MKVDRDRQLVEALRRGEPAAVEQLVATYGDRAHRLASRITGTVQDTEEAVQDAFWTVVRKIATFRGKSSFGTWLYRIVANAASSKLRRRRRQGVNLSLDEVLPFSEGQDRHRVPIVDWSAKVDDPALQSELRMVLTSAIGELPADYRNVLVLRDIEGLSNLETSEILGLSVANVKSRLHRARLFLRKRLGDYLASGLEGPAEPVGYSSRRGLVPPVLCAATAGGSCAQPRPRAL